MASVDYRLIRLLDVAFGTALEPLARQALSRLESSETLSLEDDVLAARVEEDADSKALRQLKTLDAVIGGALTLEMELHDRSSELAAELNQRAQADGGEELLSGVVVVDGASAEGSLASPFRADLLSARRRKALARTLAAWKSARDQLAAQIQGAAGDHRGDR